MRTTIKTAHVLGLAMFLLLSSGLEACGAAAKGPDKQTESTVRVVVDGSGFRPPTVEVKAGPVVLVFRRTADVACAGEVVFPERKLRHALPINQDVEVRLTVKNKENVRFTCGMGMFKGKVIAVESGARES